MPNDCVVSVTLSFEGVIPDRDREVPIAEVNRPPQPPGGAIQATFPQQRFYYLSDWVNRFCSYVLLRRHAGEPSESSTKSTLGFVSDM